jgi:hypothetical protein
MSRLFVFQTVFRREKHKTKDKKQNKVKKKIKALFHHCCGILLPIGNILLILQYIVWSSDLESYGEDKIFIESTGIHCLFAFKKYVTNWCSRTDTLLYCKEKKKLRGNREMCLINRLAQQRIFVKKNNKKEKMLASLILKRKI